MFAGLVAHPPTTLSDAAPNICRNTASHLANDSGVPTGKGLHVKQAVRSQLLYVFGHLPIGAIGPNEVQQWVFQMVVDSYTHATIRAKKVAAQDDPARRGRPALADRQRGGPSLVAQGVRPAPASSRPTPEARRRWCSTTCCCGRSTPPAKTPTPGPSPSPQPVRQRDKRPFRGTRARHTPTPSGVAARPAGTRTPKPSSGPVTPRAPCRWGVVGRGLPDPSPSRGRPAGVPRSTRSVFGAAVALGRPGVEPNLPRPAARHVVVVLRRGAPPPLSCNATPATPTSAPPRATGTSSTGLSTPKGSPAMKVMYDRVAAAQPQPPRPAPAPGAGSTADTGASTAGAGGARAAHGGGSGEHRTVGHQEGRTVAGAGPAGTEPAAAGCTAVPPAADRPHAAVVTRPVDLGCVGVQPVRCPRSRWCRETGPGKGAGRAPRCPRRLRSAPPLERRPTRPRSSCLPRSHPVRRPGPTSPRAALCGLAVQVDVKVDRELTHGWSSWPSGSWWGFCMHPWGRL